MDVVNQNLLDYLKLIIKNEKIKWKDVDFSKDSQWPKLETMMLKLNKNEFINPTMFKSNYKSNIILLFRYKDESDLYQYSLFSKNDDYLVTGNILENFFTKVDNLYGFKIKS